MRTASQVDRADNLLKANLASEPGERGQSFGMEW